MKVRSFFSFCSLFFLSLPAAAGLFGLGGGPREALLWVPQEPISTAELARFAAAFEKCPGLSLTIGLSPLSLNAESKQILAPLLKDGRIEIALRIPGDPLLPLVAHDPKSPRPQDVGRLAAVARQGYFSAFGVLPSGFVPGGGALSRDLLGPIKSLQFSWAASGSYPRKAGSWIEASGIKLVPFMPYPLARAAASAQPDSGGPFWVIDEEDGIAPPGFLMERLDSWASSRAPDYATVSKALGGRSFDQTAPMAPLEIAPWGGSYDPWTSSPASRTAWRLYTETARALSSYQNSGSAELDSLETATDDLDKAQAGRYYRLESFPSPRGEALDEEFRDLLVMVYRKIASSPPENLYSPILSSSGPPPAPGTAAQPPDFIHSRLGADWLEFDAPPRSISLAPTALFQSTPSTAGSTQAAAAPASVAYSSDVWKILSLRVEWNQESLVFIYKMAALSDDPSTPYGLGPLLLDTYIDLNHLPGVGRTSLLPGRRGFLDADEGWEYALSVSGYGAWLYRSAAGRRLTQAAAFPVQADRTLSEIRVSVPRTRLRGMPSRWGFVVLALAAAPENPSPQSLRRKPPVPFRDPRSGVILGCLAPLRGQKKVLENPSGFSRLKALRL